MYKHYHVYANVRITHLSRQEYFSLGRDSDRLLRLACPLVPNNIFQDNNYPSRFIYTRMTSSLIQRKPTSSIPFQPK